MTLDDAIKTAKAAAIRTGWQNFVVHDPRPGVDDAKAFHAGDHAALASVWVNAQRIASVHPDGRVFLLINQPVAT